MNEIDAKVIQHDEQIKTLFNRVNKLENVVDRIDNLAISVERLAVNQTRMLEQQTSLKKDVDEIKNQPVKDAHEIKMAVISCIITGIVSVVLGAILALVIKG